MAGTAPGVGREVDSEVVDTPGGIPEAYYTSPFAVYCPVKWNRDQQSACTYYRVKVPMHGIHDLDLADPFIDDGRWPSDFSISAALSSDINLLYGLTGPTVKKMVDQTRELEPGEDRMGRLRYPPSVVWDIDDCIEYVHPYNITFSHFGFRNFDGTEMHAGDSLVVRLEDGREIPLWVDQKTRGHHNEVFDVARNKKFVHEAHTMPAYADGATFSTPRLGKWYEENWGVKDWYCYPNSVITKHYPQVDLLPRTDGSVRIVWQGGMSHAPDWYPVAEATVEVMRKHPKAKLVIWGDPNLGIRGKIPPEQIEYMPWCEYGEYKPRRMLVDADINLCPLVSSPFNECKSAIKWYEASMPKRPEVTLAANVPPFSDEVTDGETGLLYNSPEDFAQKLESLILGAELRQRLAENAKRWVLMNRAYEVTVPGLFQYYQQLREKRKAKYKKPKLVLVGR